MIKYVFIDLDNTIFDFDTAEKRALFKMLETIGVVPGDELYNCYHKANISQWKRLELGEITKAQVKVNRYKILFDKFGIEKSPETATKIYEDFLCQGHIFLEGAKEFIENLSSKYCIYIMSNGTLRVQRGRLASSGIAPLFDGIFISEEMGAEKPDKVFFENAFSTIEGFDKNKAVIIGDSLTSDIKGGKNAGIKTIWFNRLELDNDSEIIPDYTVNSFEEINELLKHI